MTFVNVHSNLKTFQNRITAVAQKQIPFATAQALTTLAREVTKAEKTNESQKLDRPRPFTQDAVRAIPARKGLPIARVVMMDRTAGYLMPYEFGGSNILNGKALLKPIAQMDALDQYGNLPQKRLAQLKSRKDVFVGRVKTKIGWVSGVWQRSVEEGAKVKVATVTKTGQVRIRRTAKAVNTSGKLKLLIKFSDAHPVRQNLDWFGVAERLVNKRFNAVFGAALAKAIASAKP